MKKIDKPTNEQRLVELLSECRLHISCAESCTGGLLMSRIVDVPAASGVFDGGFVTYSEQMKCELLNIDKDIINKYGVVSEQTASAMARGCAEKTGANVGIGITGVAGPSGGTAKIPVGTVCFGFYINGKITALTVHFGEKGRNTVRRLSADCAITEVLKLLSKITV